MNKKDYQAAMRQIYAEKEELIIKAKQIQARYDEQQNQSSRSIHMKRGWLTGIIAASVLLVCSTFTVGAINNWNYTAVFHKYFSEKSGKKITYDFSDMGMDINESYKQNGYELKLGSVIADANSLYISYNFRLDEEYAMKLPQMNGQIYGRLLPSMHLKDADGSYIKDGITVSRISKQNEDGSFDCVARHSIDNCSDYSDKTLVVDIGVPAYAGTLSYMQNTDTSEEGIHTPLPTSSERHMYSLNGITNIKGITNDNGIRLIDGSYSAYFDSVTVSPLGITFRCADIPVTPPESTEPNVKIGQGSYGYEFTPSLCEEEEGAELGAQITHYYPVPAEYRNTHLRSVTLVYRDGTELEAELENGIAIGRTKMSESGEYDLMDIYAAVDFTTPLSLDNLTAVRINGREMPMQ